MVDNKGVFRIKISNRVLEQGVFEKMGIYVIVQVVLAQKGKRCMICNHLIYILLIGCLCRCGLFYAFSVSVHFLVSCSVGGEAQAWSFGPVGSHISDDQRAVLGEKRAECAVLDLTSMEGGDKGFAGWQDNQSASVSLPRGPLSGVVDAVPSDSHANAVRVVHRPLSGVAVIAIVDVRADAPAHLLPSLSVVTGVGAVGFFGWVEGDGRG